MSYSNGIITAPINVSDPYYVLGIGKIGSDWDILYPICVAKVGGVDCVINTQSGSMTFKSAFRIEGCVSDGGVEIGQIFEGAEPYWNMWNPKAPGFLSIGDINVISDIQIRINNLVNGINRRLSPPDYWCDLSSWDGYNHNEEGVHSFFTFIGHGSETFFSAGINFGSYDWAGVFKHIIYDKLSFRCIVRDKLQPSLSWTLDMTDMTSDPHRYDVVGNRYLSKPVDRLWVYVEIQVAIYKYTAATEKYSLIRAASLKRLLGLKEYNLIGDKASYGTLTTVITYIDKTSVVLSKDMDSPNLAYNYSYRFPRYTDTGQLNSIPSLPTKLSYVLSDYLTQTTLVMDSVPLILPEMSDKVEHVGWGVINYPYKATNLVLELRITINLRP